MASIIVLTIVTAVIAVSIIIIVFTCFTAENTLQQLHVIFRHGARNPLQRNLYPTDPNINDTWAPEGPGELTMYGKLQVYNMGVAVRRRYGKFLGDYSPDLIDPISSNLNRAKLSLEAVLDGLFPAASSETWKRPLPYNSVSWVDNPVMRFALVFCPKYIFLCNEAERSDYFQNFWTSNIDLINYMTENSGIQITNYTVIIKLFDTLFSEIQTGRKIPSWTDKIFPEFFTKVENIFYELTTYTEEMNKISGGDNETHE